MALAAATRAPVSDSDGLTEYLSDRHMLIVLDNCEHVIGEVSDLIDGVLADASEIRVLATSREPLGLDGEVVRRVGSLPVPPSESSVEEALSTASVRLFVERATAVAESFVLDDSTVAPVVDICRHLDGIPLAVELAAARVRSMPPAEISRRLDERFRLLGGGSRRVQERHRTLLATVSWSHDLLTAAEQEVFRLLAVFPASFTLDAGEALVGLDGAEKDVVGCVLGLVDKSLVQFDPEEGRYRLLETFRQFAADRLADAGETTVTRERHARFFLDLVDHQAARFLGEHYLTALAILVPETDNLRGAATWCFDHARWGDLAALCRQTLYFAIQSSPVDGVAWRQQVLAHLDRLDPRIAVEILGELSYLQLNGLGDYEAAGANASQSLALADAEGIPHCPRRCRRDRHGRHPPHLHRHPELRSQHGNSRPAAGGPGRRRHQRHVAGRVLGVDAPGPRTDRSIGPSRPGGAGRRSDECPSCLRSCSDCSVSFRRKGLRLGGLCPGPLRRGSPPSLPVRQPRPGMDTGADRRDGNPHADAPSVSGEAQRDHGARGPDRILDRPGRAPAGLRVHGAGRGQRAVHDPGRHP